MISWHVHVFCVFETIYPVCKNSVNILIMIKIAPGKHDLMHLWSQNVESKHNQNDSILKMINDNYL